MARQDGQRVGRSVQCVPARGSILLETAFALLFISIFLGAISGLFVNSIARVRQARLRTRAMLLAETKLAELQVGLIDITEDASGDFDGRPEKFTWSIEMQPTDNPELRQLTLTITYDDPSDGFTYQLHRVFSPSLNYSYEQLKDVASDPSQLQSLESRGLQELVSMANELPEGDRLIRALIGGGVSEMIGLFDQLVTGKISPEQVLTKLGLEADEADEEASSPEMTRADRPAAGELPPGNTEADLEAAEVVDVGNRIPVWTNPDTTETASTDSTELVSAPTGRTRRSGRRGRGRERPTRQPEATASEGQETGDQLPTGPMDRGQAMRRMMEILRRMAAQRR